MNGNFITENNISVFNKVTQRFIDEPAIIMMKDIGSPLRIGEYKELETYFNSIPKELNENMELIQFNEFKLSAQEICNLLNYLQNYSIGKEKWDEIKSYDEVQMKGFLKWIETLN